MNNRRKAIIATTASLMFLLIILISMFLSTPVSPLGKYIVVCLECEQTGEGIPGVDVTITGEGFEATMPTGKNGCTGPFGSGLVDGDYVIEYFWCGERYAYNVTIECSKITWYFTYEVPNPEIIKHFVYNICEQEFPPVVGLNVSLYEDGAFKAWQLTNGEGTVRFDGTVVGFCHDYTLNWTWGGIPAGEGPIHFDCPPECCIWEKTNELEPKSGGDK